LRGRATLVRPRGAAALIADLFRRLVRPPRRSAAFRSSVSRSSARAFARPAARGRAT